MPTLQGPKALHTLISDKASQYLCMNPWRPCCKAEGMWLFGALGAFGMCCMSHAWFGDQEGCFSCCLQGGCVFIPCGCSGLGRAELGDLHDIAGTLNTLVQPVCPPLDHCPLPSCPSAASPVTPSTGCGHRSPWGCRRDRGSSRFGWRLPQCPSLAMGTHTCSLEQSQST